MPMEFKNNVNNIKLEIYGLKKLRLVLLFSITKLMNFGHQPFLWFVGIDIFFVISGYLISILLKELITGSFSLKYFERQLDGYLIFLIVILVLSLPFARYIYYQYFVDFQNQL